MFKKPIQYYLAIDIGASGGRHILGWIENGILKQQEVHRFENGPKQQDGQLVWDLEYLFSEILFGLKKCKTNGTIPCRIGIDTWGVDYVLLDRSDRVILPAFSYRDSRTEHFTGTAVPFAEMYKTTGTAFNRFNTVYQLLADQADGRLENAEEMLMLPEYFSFLLTQKKAREYTNASTTGLLDAGKRDWDHALIERLGLPKKLFAKPVEPGYRLGRFSDAIQEEVGFSSLVVLPATHDTASAVVSVPEKDSVYISSGTWSLLGIEGAPVLTDEARVSGFSNEGALNGKVRFQKNIMGLWVIQQIRHEHEDAFSFSELAEMAEQETAFRSVIDIDRPRFFAPPSMTEAVQNECREMGLAVPDTIAKLAKCVFLSLATNYQKAIKELERLTSRSFTRISIIGGGCKNDYLNRLTAQITGIDVFAGPDEATATGNLLTLISGDGVAREEIKALIRRSFQIKEIKNHV